MEFLELILLALEALKTNMVRTILTMLGVIIGIASVIIIVSLGQSTTQSIVTRISSFGANILTVSAGRAGRGPGGGGTVDTLTLKDVEALTHLENVAAVTGMVNASKQISYGSTTTQASITGVEPQYAAMHSLSFIEGNFFSESQNTTQAKVVILGDQKVIDLFGSIVPVVGETVKISGKNFKIIGVVNDSSGVYLPLTTVQKVLLNQDYLNSLEIAANESNQVTALQEAATASLLLRHGLENSNDADFSVRSSQEMISSISSVTSSLTAMLSGIAAISLVVGGIGIMNIMLVTVTERTREIGLLKAIGAKKRDVLWQFLIEAVVVTLVGGIIGISLGVLVTLVATQLLSVPFVVSAWSVVLALGVSMGVGILFGWYPANQAARLQPIDALRYE